MMIRSNKQRIGIEATGQVESQALTLVAIQGIIAKEMSQAQRDWQMHKQEILKAIHKESKVDQHLTALEAKMDNIEYNVKQMNEKAQALEQIQSRQQQPINNVTNVVKLMGQDVVGHHNLQERFDQIESLENRQRKNNIRLKKVKEFSYFKSECFT